MATYTVTAPSGKTLEIQGDKPPTEAELQAIFSQASASASPASDTSKLDQLLKKTGRTSFGAIAPDVMAAEGERTASGMEAVKGFAKGAARSVIDLGELVRMIPGVSSGVDKLYGTPGLSDTAFAQAHQKTAYSNTEQRVGGAAETAAELLAPAGKAVNAVPRLARAGKNFETVMGAAKNIPIDVNAPGQVGLRILELSDAGAQLPQVVRKFLNRVTSPKKAPVTYKEARDFASNVSRLSADEAQRLTPVIKRELADLRVTLNASIAEAAKKAGKLDEYQAAMKEYAQAMKMRDAISKTWKGVKKAAVPAGVGGAAYYGARKIRQTLAPE